MEHQAFNGEQEEANDNILTLVDEEGNTLLFEAIGSYELDGKVYVALVTADTDEDEDQYLVLRQEEDENGETTFVTIDDDDEFDRVSDYFNDALFTEVDYDEL